MTLVKDILETCEQIENGRTAIDILAYGMTEVGEVSEEVLIKYSPIAKHKTSGPDGIIGEAMDVILCMMDLIHEENPDITEEELQAIARLKLDKWKKNS